MCCIVPPPSSFVTDMCVSLARREQSRVRPQGFPSHGAALFGKACLVFVVKPESATSTYNL